MSKRIVNSLWSTVIVLGLAVGATLSSAALPAAATSADDESVSVSDSRATVTGYFSPADHLSLGNEKVIHQDPEADLMFNKPANGKAQSVVMSYDYPGEGVGVRVAYPISRLDQPTGYWLQIELEKPTWNNAQGRCGIFAGVPGTAGAEEPTWGSPFQCTKSLRNLSSFDFALSKVTDWRTAGIDMKTREGLGFGTGKRFASTSALIDLLEDENHRPTGMRARWIPGLRNIEAKSAHPIEQFGEASGYWVESRIYNGGVSSLAYAECAIFAGEPGTPGVDEPTWASPFQCETHRHGSDNDFDVVVDVVGGIAESSGTIRTEDGLTLTRGRFTDFGISFFRPAADSIDGSDQSRFDTVLRTSDTSPTQPGRAPSEFQYLIVDNGVTTSYTLFGANDDGGKEYCYVFPAGRYDCEVKGHAVSNVHWDSTFTLFSSNSLIEAAK